MDLNKLWPRLLSSLLLLTLAACSGPDNTQVNARHLERASAYQEQGQYKAAIIEYKNAVKKSNGDVEVMLQYAKMLNSLGHYGAALNLLEQSKGQKTEAYHVVLVTTFIGMNKYLSAEAVLRDYLTSNSTEIQLLEAEIQFGLEEFDAASTLYDQILAKNDLDNAALLGKAKILARDGDTGTKAALGLLNKIQKQSEPYNRGRILMAGIQLAQNDMEAAEATLSELLSFFSNTDLIEPEKAMVLERLAYVLTRQGRTNEAYIYTKLLAEAFPGVNEVQKKYKSAVEKFQAKEFDEAQKILSGILEEYPSYNKATQLLGVISYLRGDNELASKYLSESVDPEVANPMTRHIYAATNLKLNDPKKVLEILEPSIEKETSSQTLALYGLAAISDKQYSKGEAALLKGIELDTSNISIRLALAGFYRNGLYKDADKEWKQLSKAFEFAPIDKYVLKEMVSYHLRFNGVDKAAQFIDSALVKNPDDYATNLIAGFFAMNEGKLEKALGFYIQAIEDAPVGDERMGALLAKGQVEASLKRYSDAEKTYNLLVHDYPESEWAYKGLLYVTTLQYDADKAILKLEQIAEKSRQTTPYAVLIKSVLVSGNIDAANAYFQKIKAIDSEDKSIEVLEFTINYATAAKAVTLKKFDEARKLIAPILISQPSNLKVLAFLVDLELRADKLNEAEKVLGQLESLSPSLPIMALLKGELALKNKDFQEAKKQFLNAWANYPSEVAAEKLFKVLGLLKQTSAQDKHLKDWVVAFPNNPLAVLFQAVKYQQRGQLSKAIDGYTKVLKVAPDNVMALNNLGWIYFEKDDDTALELLKRASELAPESAAVLDSYGWVLAKSGQVDRGLVYLEKANQLSPENKEIADHLAIVKKM
ncbi:MAG: tetratricopeptide (TPR) repeat protein [Pseudohongiellaceae bacterium]|jgi:tetratricopeptide (TPR) repeat protein